MRVLLTADPELAVPPRLYGGIERIVADLATWLRKHGLEVGLVAHAASSADVDYFLPWASASSSDRVQNALRLVRACRAFRPLLVHSFSRLAYLLPVVECGWPGLMSFQRPPTSSTIRWSAWLAGRKLVFTGCSDHISRLGRAAGGRWVTVPNFVDLARYSMIETVPPDAPLVFLSRVEAVKGAEWAITIARESRRRLIIAGNHADSGPEGRYFEERIRPWLGQDGVAYIGPVDDKQKAALLRDAAALLVPVQWDEPFGIVFVEGLACGTPVIACPRGALPEIVEDGVTGYLVTSIEKGVEAVSRLNRISRASCRARAESLFSSDVAVPRYVALYEELAQCARRS